MDINAFIDKNLTFEDLTKTEKDVYFYFLKNLNRIPLMSSENVAEECFCTTTTVNRTCKKMGIDGFNEFKTLVKYNNILYGFSENNKNEVELQTDFEIEAFLTNIDFNSNVYVNGTGSSEIVARYLVRQLLLKGITVIFVDDRYLLNKIIKDQVIIVSNSGMTGGVIDCAINAKNNNAKIFAITAKDSDLEKMADYAITHTKRIETLNSKEHERPFELMKLVDRICDYIERQ